MALLAGAHYDPAAAVSKATTAALGLTAIDTTNLRLTFTAPSNGCVLVRLRGVLHGAATWPQILLGVLDGSTVKGRQAPVGALRGAAVSNTHMSVEALFTVTGLTPGNSYTWDAAYGVETLVNATGLKYGGPNDASQSTAFGGFVFEIWEAPTLLAAVMYDPAAAVSKGGSLAAMTALDTTNLRLTFTAPASGIVLPRLRGCVHGATTMSMYLLGILDGSTVKGKQSPVGGLLGTALATTYIPQEAEFVVAGLTPGNSYTWDAAYGSEVSVAASLIKYGGPNNNTANDAFGGFLYEIWAA